MGSPFSPSLPTGGRFGYDAPPVAPALFGGALLGPVE